MKSIANIATSGMQAAQTRMQSSANNVANLATDNFRREEVQQSAQAGGGVQTTLGRSAQTGPALEQDVVAQLQAKNAFLMNLAVFKASDRMTGALLDTKA